VFMGVWIAVGFDINWGGLGKEGNVMVVGLVRG